MALSEPVERVRRLGPTPDVGALVMIEQAIDLYAAGYTHLDERRIALDILLRDLARLRTIEPDLDVFIAQVESYIDSLHCQLTRQAA
ncbi:hypothetical protein MKK63_30515 [Methylobacterium sp. J-088]|uniref:hypothetical protein n=1 Tax=unclassified Methylobacterium TaxID=2615210 RepID=UPI001FB93C1D|nr:MULTISPECIES: hypothetical protein [unclassified Methylobacterium]MCJ2066990.1 hypothetical protein [Methylobacterium sp. J-088]